MDWVTCAHSGACTGFAHQPHGSCLFHAAPERRAEVLRTLGPGRLVDLRGTTIDAELLERVLEATGRRPGRTRLDRAHFTGETRFAGVAFLGDVSLDGARFDRLASFFGARFEGNVSLAGARFAREVSFHGVRVRGHLSLDRALLARDALFSQTACGRGLSCERARFDGFATFDGAVVGDGAVFRGARFGRTLSFRKVVGPAGFDTAHFLGNVYVSLTGRLSAAHVHAENGLDLCVTGSGADLRHAEVTGPLLLRLTDAQADLESAVLHDPSAVSGRGRAALTSLREVRAATLSLSGLDLSTCRFSGYTDPAGLRLKNCAFALTPSGVRFGLRWPPLRWFSRRRSLADEHLLRGWSAPGEAAASAERLAVLYTGLRAGLDDEAVAGDFAFGAMEMRRKAGASRRWWLALSWLLCGYGLRMGRAAVWLVILMAIVAGVFWTSTSHATRRALPAGPDPAIHLR
ncbi:pentapeptide repeat-containing protein [Nonomuraea sp. NPDC050790]|uniref:pentapeptide repeat-containing protein n=1 Tax=Nonomuraea sp. NPDC050790 TaxID=3364371 RepID=UPI00379FF28B